MFLWWNYVNNIGRILEIFGLFMFYHLSITGNRSFFLTVVLWRLWQFCAISPPAFRQISLIRLAPPKVNLDCRYYIRTHSVESIVPSCISIDVIDLTNCGSFFVKHGSTILSLKTVCSNARRLLIPIWVKCGFKSVCRIVLIFWIPCPKSVWRTVICSRTVLSFSTPSFCGTTDSRARRSWNSHLMERNLNDVFEFW